MKKILSTLLAALCIASFLPLAAATYDNNEYQRKSRAYSDMAARAYDDGDYTAAVEYAKIAEENARLSAAFIQGMIARSDAEKTLYAARTRLAWAKGIKAEVYFPAAVKSAADSIDVSAAAFASESWPQSKAAAQAALDSLSVVKEIIPLPASWTVELWNPSKDCLWNIAANPAVYGDPLLWEKLYDANKKALKQPSNPNLLMPGQTIVIPSIKGEFREGPYDKDRKYEPFKNQVSQ